jgi:tellurite resistance protein TehA-like permease
MEILICSLAQCILVFICGALIKWINTKQLTWKQLVVFSFLSSIPIAGVLGGLIFIGWLFNVALGDDESFKS